MQTELEPSGDARVTLIDLPPTAGLVLPICRAIGLVDLVDAACPMKRGRHLRHGQVAEFIVLSILQVPQRPPLYKMNVWAEEYGLNWIYGHPAAAFNDDRIGRALDAIGEQVDELDEALSVAAAQLAEVKLHAAHWDFKHVTFSEGKFASDLICKGYGDGSIHPRLVQLSVHMDSETGLPVHHETLPGNTNQARLSRGMFECLQQRFRQEGLIVISDRAAIDYDNVITYQSLKGRFGGPLRVVSPEIRERLARVPREQFTPLRYRSMHQERPLNYYYATQITLRVSRKALAAAKAPDPDSGELPPQPQPAEVDALFILNVDRQLDDEAQRAKALRKCLARFRYIADRVGKAGSRYRNYAFALKEVKKAVPRALKGIVGYELSPGETSPVLRYWVDRKALRQAKRGDGRYVLLHSLGDIYSPDEIFELYRRQGALERQFRGLSNDLEINPLWLQKEGRIKALVLLYYVAMVVFAMLGLLARRAYLATEHYYIMTPREMLHRCGALRLIITQAPGQLPNYQLKAAARQRQILDALDLPSLSRCLAAPP